MSNESTPLRDRFARRWLLYFLVVVAAGGIALLRQQARRVDATRAMLVIGAAPLVDDAQSALESRRSYTLEVTGDRARLARHMLYRVRVINVESRVAAVFGLSPQARLKRDVGDGRIRQTLGTIRAPGDGEFLVRLEISPPVTGVTTDSFFVLRTPSGREFSQSFGMLALGGVIFVVVLAIGGVVGRSFLDRDAT
jgi:hypothetical protein